MKYGNEVVLSAETCFIIPQYIILHTNMQLYMQLPTQVSLLIIPYYINW